VLGRRTRWLQALVVEYSWGAVSVRPRRPKRKLPRRCAGCAKGAGAVGRGGAHLERAVHEDGEVHALGEDAGAAPGARVLHGVVAAIGAARIVAPGREALHVLGVRLAVDAEEEIHLVRRARDGRGREKPHVAARDRRGIERG